MIGHWVRTQLFDQVPVSICVIDQDFTIVEANRRFVNTYGAWKGRHCYEVYKGRKQRCEHCGAAKTFDDGQIRVREETGVLRNGHRTHYMVQIVALKHADGAIPYVVEMSTDITQMKLLEQEKFEAERLAAVGQTVAGLAHGIKNVLMGLEGGMYVVSSGIRKSDSARIGQGWHILEENVARIASFVREFLDFAKGRTPHVAVVKPNEVALKVIDLFRHKAALAGIELRVALGEDIKEASLDEEGIHVCLSNLVSNALDACEMSAKENRHVSFSTFGQDRTLIYEVADNGCGMDYEIRQKVFTNFFSTKGSGKGTGLGLLTTKRIVQEHGGKVSFESTEGEGSVFRIELPRDRLPSPKKEN